MQLLEDVLFKKTHGFASRFRILLYKLLGATIGKKNRMENGRIRRCRQVEIGNNNAFTEGWYIWPIEGEYNGKRIKIGDRNYFNRNIMIDACGLVEIGNFNMFGPDIYITDSNHTYGLGLSPSNQPMLSGQVRIGNHCWLGAKAIILKDVVLGDYCVVAAGAVVTRSFPSGSVVGGVPAQLIKKNDMSQNQENDKKDN